MDPGVLARIGNLELVSRAVVDGFINGLHKTPYFGASVDFAEHRGYVPGDDIRRMDWRLWARTDRYYIKEYEAESNMNFSVLLDASKSMDYGSRGITKFDYARILTACLTNLVHHQRDRVGFVAFDTEVVEHVPPSAKHMETVLHVLERLKPGRPGSLKEPLHRLAEHFGRRGVLVLISDLYEDPDAIVDAVSPLRFRGNDLDRVPRARSRRAGVRLLRRPAVRGSGERRADAGGAGGVPRGIPSLVRRHIDALQQAFSAVRVDYSLLDTSKPLDFALFRTWAREKMMNPAIAMNFPRPAVLRRAGRTGHSRAAAPDAAREEADHPVSVADVRAADSVSVRAPAEDPQLAAAARPGGGAGADHLAFARPFFAGGDAAAPDRARASWWCCSTELQHGLRGSLGAGARGGACRHQRSRCRATADRWCCFRRARRSRCARSDERAAGGGGRARRSPAPAPRGTRRR